MREPPDSGKVARPRDADRMSEETTGEQQLATGCRETRATISQLPRELEPTMLRNGLGANPSVGKRASGAEAQLAPAVSHLPPQKGVMRALRD